LRYTLALAYYFLDPAEFLYINPRITKMVDARYEMCWRAHELAARTWKPPGVSVLKNYLGD
jgi:hypothetical protein